MSEQAIEQEIQAKGLTAPRLSPSDIDAAIVGETYTTLPSGKVMVCELTLRNGFTVRGEAATVSKANFNEEIGRKISRENARDKVWELEGYLLQQRLSEVAAVPSDFRDRVRAEAAELDDRINKLAAFLPSDTFNNLSKDEQDRLTSQLAAMQDYSACLSERIRAFGGAA